MSFAAPSLVIQRWNETKYAIIYTVIIILRIIVKACAKGNVATYTI